MATRTLHPVIAAVGSVIIAGVIRLLLHPLLASDAPLLVFVVAVVVSAVYGGAKAGLLATALSVLVSSSLFASPIWAINGVNTSELVRIAVFVAEGVLVAWLVARIDVEHQQLLRAKAEAENAKRQAEEASSAKDAFLAMISHELRTPLNVILGYARLLRGKEAVGPERVRQVAAIIERNAVLKTRLVEDLLDVKRIERGQLSLERRTFDLAPLIASVRDSLSDAATAKRLHVKALVPSTITMEGDAARIQQVLWNLLSNAVKFTPEGGHCDIRAAIAGDTVEIQVENSGAPIPTAFLPRLFEQFQQADMSSSRRHAGIGLGLWIVKQIVELHGGSVQVESRDRTTFTVVLPRTQASPLESLRSASVHVH